MVVSDSKKKVKTEPAALRGTKGQGHLPGFSTMAGLGHDLDSDANSEQRRMSLVRKGRV